MRAGTVCNCRGPIFVKGKGMITTYFVRTPFDDKKPSTATSMTAFKPYQRM
jgi:hypothetical protein